MIAIIYAATAKPADWQDYSYVPAYPPNPGGYGVFVRLEIDQSGDDVVDVGIRAKPREGETFLNSIEI